MRRRRNPNIGFTLLEMMLTLAIMALIAVMIGSTLSSSVRMLSRSIGFDHDVDYAVARFQLRTLVEATLPLPMPADQDKIFSGKFDYLSFQAVVDDGQFWPGVPVKVVLERAANGVITITSSGLTEGGRDELQLVFPLTSSSGTVQLQYYGRLDASQDIAWRTDWSAQNGLPILIKLTLQDGDRNLPPIVLQPAKTFFQSEMSLSSLVPPARPSRP